jgi:hypothetical protein
MTSVTGNVTLYGTSSDGTWALTQAEFGDVWLYNTQCNLATGYPYVLDNAGIHMKFFHTTNQAGVLQQTDFRVHTTQSYVQTSGGNQSAPYKNTFNAYYDDITNKNGNFTVCCSNFHTSNQCYGPTTTPTPMVSLSSAHPQPMCDTLVATIVGDPQFVGFRGQRYQIHGIDSQVYSIISDRFMQMNSRFVFLTAGICPVVGGIELGNCFIHPGTYFQSVGIMTADGHKIFVEAGNADYGFSVVSIDDVDLDVGDEEITITRVSTHLAVVTIGIYTIDLENSDGFLNVISVVISNMQKLVNTIQSHGLLGQTWQHSDALEGQIEDYAESDDNLFGCNFVFNKFACEHSRHPTSHRA